MKKTFYITTAIDYVNSLPHIGTAYEKIGADVLARWMRKNGREVRFQMGNDEHSTNVIKAARAKGLEPKVYCDEMRKKFEDVWKRLEISYDDFIQTSEERHIKGVQELFQKIYDAGDIKKSHYEGWYCESCEAFYTEKDLVEGVCPNHKSKPTWIKEENYFFSLSKYADRLLKHISKNPDFIQPEGRRNEVISMIKQGLLDISVSRSGFEWGIKVPFDNEHSVYVWFDALINYATAAGYGTDKGLFKKLWPADVHVVGKDIIRFHCVIWPAMLMSAGIELPKTVFAHGFVYLKGERMSKTLGNVVNPLEVVDKFGADPLRYYLMRGSSFGKDADFTWDNFIERYNADLANGIGNLVARTHAMIEKNFDGAPPKHPDIKKFDQLKEKVSAALDFTKGDINFHLALSSIMEAVSETDRHINENKPWALAKSGDTKKLSEVLGYVYRSIASISELLEPFIPETALKIKRQLGFKEGRLGPAEMLFPRIETKPEVKSQPSEAGGQRSEIGTSKKEMKTEAASEKPAAGLIEITDFAKIDLRVAEVKEAVQVEGADKLLKLQIRLGDETRQIVAGIAKHYRPEDLIGKKIVVVANLKPAKLRGVESNGMLLAASAEDKVVILTPEKDLPSGSKVK